MALYTDSEQGVRNMTKEEIYDYMTINFVEPSPDIPFEFEEGSPCMELYGRTCNARMRIAARTGLDFEDRDLLEIVECMEEIAKICGLKMYEYGVKYGHTK